MIAIEQPSFIVVGPPRTGTSWLHRVLEPYATLPSPSKETRFFDLHFHRGPDWYSWHFPKDRKGPVGEIAPTYFASAIARRRIAKTAPSAKIVFIFRNPVERAVSLYRLKRAYGMFRWSFEEALHRDPELINSGLYWSHLSGWRELFPDKQLLVSIYEDLVRDPQAFVNRIAEFIGLPAITLSKSQLQRAFSSEQMTQPRSYLATRTATAFADWCKSKRLDHLVASVRDSALLKLFLGGGASLPYLPPSALGELAEIFRPEVEALETDLNRKLEHWKKVRTQQNGTSQDEVAVGTLSGAGCSKLS
jgi:LPS sulfotransferase NodH